jgi:hypothetical protein
VHPGRGPYLAQYSTDSLAPLASRKAPGTGTQGLTLVHFTAQLRRIVLCRTGVIFLGGVRGY